MSAVFEVRHHLTNRRLAIKWLLPDNSDAESVARLVREAQVSGRFDHPNAVQVYDLVLEASELPFMVMELLDGENLADRLKWTSGLSVSHALRIMLPCLDAISAAHAAGIIHRDIKPANIFLCRGTKHTPERPKVLDFGIARLLPMVAEDGGFHTKSGTIIGTPHYMAPEQMRGRPADERIDVYSLGVTLYEVLSGQRPFQAATYPELVLLVNEAQVRPLDQLVPGLPVDLAQIVARAMARDPADRFSSVDDLASELSTYYEESGVSLLASMPSTHMDRMDRTPTGTVRVDRTPTEPVPRVGVPVAWQSGGVTPVSISGVVVEPGAGAGAAGHAEGANSRTVEPVAAMNPDSVMFSGAWFWASALILTAISVVAGVGFMSGFPGFSRQAAHPELPAAAAADGGESWSSSRDRSVGVPDVARVVEEGAGKAAAPAAAALAVGVEPRRDDPAGAVRDSVVVSTVSPFTPPPSAATLQEAQAPAAVLNAGVITPAASVAPAVRETAVGPTATAAPTAAPAALPAANVAAAPAQRILAPSPARASHPTAVKPAAVEIAAGQQQLAEPAEQAAAKSDAAPALQAQPEPRRASRPSISLGGSDEYRPQRPANPVAHPKASLDRDGF